MISSAKFKIQDPTPTTSRKQNIESINKPPLPEDVAGRLREMFKRVDSVTGN
jgi:hypothetical protein